MGKGLTRSSADRPLCHVLLTSFAATLATTVPAGRAQYASVSAGADPVEHLARDGSLAALFFSLRVAWRYGSR